MLLHKQGQKQKRKNRTHFVPHGSSANECNANMCNENQIGISDTETIGPLNAELRYGTIFLYIDWATAECQTKMNGMSHATHTTTTLT